MDAHHPTEDQRKDHIRLRRYIERERLIPVMNATKWREALQIIEGLQPEYRVRFRAKWVRETQPPHWDSSFPSHLPRPFVGIEWLDIATVDRFPGTRDHPPFTMDRTDEIIKGLRAHNIPFTYTDGVVRIWGYLRPGSEVVFASNDTKDA